MKTQSAAAIPPTTTGTGRTFNPKEVPWLGCILLLGCGVIALGPLTPTWDSNPNYSFGWWIPIVSLILLAERWPSHPPREETKAKSLTPGLILWGVLFLAFRLAAETDPDWRPGLWILVSLYVVVVFGWLWLEGGASWVRHFAFPICFLFLSVPWLFGIEYPLVQGLMRWNAVLASDSLHWIGISAEPAGNIIQLQNCQLGVEEACSGILSLQASLMMGCLLGDIYRLQVLRRILLVLAGMTLALFGNYLRTFFLAVMAFYNGADAVPQWHDTAGYAILVFTAIGTWVTSLCLIGKKTSAAVAVETSPAVDKGTMQPRSALRFAAIIFAAALLAEAVTQAWFGWRESSLSHHPEWSARFPTSITSFKQITPSDVTLEALRCDSFNVGQWRDDHGWNWNVYWLSYEPKPYTRIVLSWHVPDNCLPSVGMTKDRDYPDFTASVNGLDFYVHPKRFLLKGAPVYVFWVVYPKRGDLPSDNYHYTNVPFASKFQSHLHDIWNGYRGVGVETLETVLMGPNDYDIAKARYLSELKTIAWPVTSATPQESGTSR